MDNRPPNLSFSTTSVIAKNVTDLSTTLTCHTPEVMCTPKNSFVLVHQNIRGIISKIEELQEFFISDKMYPHALFF
jgi:hypothetical protein